MQAPDNAAEASRYVFCERPKCPRCKSPKLHTDRSTDQGDGTMQRHTTCKICQHKFFVIVE